MQIGQKCTIKDGSYMTTIVDGFPAHYSKNIDVIGWNQDIIGWNQDIWEIIDTNLILPACNYFGEVPKNINNDTIIGNTKTGEVRFCIADICLNLLSTPKIPDYTMTQLEKIVGHEFKIVN